MVRGAECHNDMQEKVAPKPEMRSALNLFSSG